MKADVLRAADVKAPVTTKKLFITTESYVRRDESPRVEAMACHKPADGCLAIGVRICTLEILRLLQECTT